jgi:hypothetical protein
MNTVLCPLKNISYGDVTITGGRLQNFYKHMLGVQDV